MSHVFVQLIWTHTHCRLSLEVLLLKRKDRTEQPGTPLGYLNLEFATQENMQGSCFEKQRCVISKLHGLPSQPRQGLSKRNWPLRDVREPAGASGGLEAAASAASREIDRRGEEGQAACEGAVGGAARGARNGGSLRRPLRALGTSVHHQQLVSLTFV